MLIPAVGGEIYLWLEEDLNCDDSSKEQEILMKGENFDER